jgi:hypothetical protein
MQGTLWPEVKKVFGHGNDLISVVADPRGEHCASACRAQNAATAAIWVSAPIHPNCHICNCRQYVGQPFSCEWFLETTPVESVVSMDVHCLHK